MERYASLSRDEVLGNIPMMFITFPSAKDPTSNIRQPGSTLASSHLLGWHCFVYSILTVLSLFLSALVGKSCMTLLTMARYEWFEEWKETRLGKRGQDYLDLKNSMAKELLDWALTVFPQLRDKVHMSCCCLHANNMLDISLFIP